MMTSKHTAQAGAIGKINNLDKIFRVDYDVAIRVPNRIGTVTVFAEKTGTVTVFARALH
jgi:hypothetical protein